MSADGPALPPAFVERLRRIVPAELLEASLVGLKDRPLVSLRLNPLVAPPQETVRELVAAGFPLQRVAWLDEAWMVPAKQRSRLTNSVPCRDGRIYIQDLSSMLAPLVLDPRPGEEVLDLAAAPGGKTIHMAALMQGQGRIAAVEPIRSRYYKLRDTLRRCGAAHVRTYLQDGRTVGRKVPQRFDRVLLDAPCSGEARFRTGVPQTWRFWSLRKIGEQARKQKGLLRSALRAVRPGGIVLYCTCSFVPEENEMVVQEALRRLGENVEVLPIELPITNVQAGLTAWHDRRLDPRLALARRILPTGEMGALFLCRLHKRARLSGDGSG